MISAKIAYLFSNSFLSALEELWWETPHDEIYAKMSEVFEKKVHSVRKCRETIHILSERAQLSYKSKTRIVCGPFHGYEGVPDIS